MKLTAHIRGRVTPALGGRPAGLTRAGREPQSGLKMTLWGAAWERGGGWGHRWLGRGCGEAGTTWGVWVSCTCPQSDGIPSDQRQDPPSRRLAFRGGVPHRFLLPNMTSAARPQRTVPKLRALRPAGAGCPQPCKTSPCAFTRAWAQTTLSSGLRALIPTPCAGCWGDEANPCSPGPHGTP